LSSPTTNTQGRRWEGSTVALLSCKIAPRPGTRSKQARDRKSITFTTICSFFHALRGCIVRRKDQRRSTHRSQLRSDRQPLAGWKVVGGAKPRPLDDLLTFPVPATKKRCGPRSATQNRNTVLTISHEYSSMPIRNQKGD